MKLFTQKTQKSIVVLLTESWYQDIKSSQAEEVEHIIITAAKLIKDGIKNHEHVTGRLLHNRLYQRQRKQFCTKYFLNVY